MSTPILPDQQRTGIMGIWVSLKLDACSEVLSCKTAAVGIVMFRLQYPGFKHITASCDQAGVCHTTARGFQHAWELSCTLSEWECLGL